MKRLFAIILNPLIGPIAVASVISAVLFFYYIPIISKENQKLQIEKEADYLVSHLKSFRAYYTEKVVSKVKGNGQIEINFDHEEKNNTIPLPATTIHDLSALFTKNTRADISFYSNYPFPNRKDRVLDLFQKDAIEYLSKNPDKIYTQEEHRDGKTLYRVATADVFTQPVCVECHNSRADSPKTDWAIGDVRGVIEVAMPIEDELVLAGEQSKNLYFLAIVGILALILHYSLLAKRRNRELRLKKEVLEEEVAKRTSDLQETNSLLQEYKKAVDASAIVSKADKSGVITYVNDEFCKISGFDRSELIGKNHNIVRDPDMPKELFERLWQTIKKGEIFKGIIKNRRKDGSSYFVSTTIVPILDSDGQISEYLSLRYDITELILAMQRAESAERAKSQFLANMSHEIRTPLNGIIGFADILKDSSLPARELEYANIIAKSAKSLLEIINDILDFSKIESGNFELSSEDFDAKESFGQIHKLFWARAKEKDIEFEFLYDKEIDRWLNADITRLSQVISNLLSNAIKFTPPGGKVVYEVRLISKDKESNKIYIGVKDSGIGIAPEKQKGIFEPFIQADGGISRQYGGTGLGLAISLNIIKQMGSQIELISEPQKGSLFYFELSLKKAKEEPKELEQSDTKSNTSYSARVLVAEDNIVNQKLMGVILTKLGITPVFAKDGNEAIEAFKKERFQLILMDINMPNCDGISATSEIRAIESIEDRVRTPIIALTANAIKGDRERFLDSGMDGYLTKPLQIQQLQEILQLYLQKQ